MWQVLLVVTIVAAGCFSVGISPEEICAKDRMLFSGRSYDQHASVGKNDRWAEKGEGIQCRRPETKQESCEVRAALASRKEKIRLCSQHSATCQGLVAKKRCKANDGATTACEIENAAKLTYREELEQCSSSDATATTAL